MAETGPTGEPAGSGSDNDELTRLRSEVSALRGQLDARRRRATRTVQLRRFAAAVLVMLAAFCAVASIVGLWAARTALNTDRWVATVTPLPKDPAVAAAVAEYSTNEIFQLVDVEQRLKEVLPERASFVAAPITGQVRDYVGKEVNTMLLSDRFQTIWVAVNRRAQPRVVAVLEGRSDVVSAQGDRVAIDLLPMINQMLVQLEAQLPTLFGHKLNLPDVSSGAIPANLRSTVESSLGVTLPSNFAQFTVYDGGRLHGLQQALVTFKRNLALLLISTVVLLGLALWVSPRRRRTVLQLGLWLVVAATVVTAVLRTVRAQLLSQVPEGLYRNGVAAALTTVTATLRVRGQQLLWLGLAAALVAYLVGPGRIPVWLRRQVLSAGRAVSRWTRRGASYTAAHGPGWVRSHLDPLRVAGLVVAVLVALVVASWAGLLVTVLVLAGYEVSVTVIARASELE